MSTKFEKIVVVGAGPTGLTLALLLAERGITVDVLESLEQVDQRPRGVAYGSPAVKSVKLTQYCPYIYSLNT